MVCIFSWKMCIGTHWINRWSVITYVLLMCEFYMQVDGDKQQTNNEQITVCAHYVTWSAGSGSRNESCVCWSLNVLAWRLMEMKHQVQILWKNKNKALTSDCSSARATSSCRRFWAICRPCFWRRASAGTKTQRRLQHTYRETTSFQMTHA